MAGTIQEINTALQQYFDKVLVLTVPRFKERQEKVKERMAGIDFDFSMSDTRKSSDDGFFV